MTFKRLLTLASLFAFLVLAAPAAAEDFGGAPAEPLALEESGGGALAPEALAPDAATAEAASAETSGELVAEPAQEETPTTPEGEEQPPGKEDGGGDTPPGEDGAPPADTGGGDVSGGGLPRTGLELLALTMIGLGLLLAGGALWPTRSWPPPPRGRLSRSTRLR